MEKAGKDLEWYLGETEVLPAELVRRWAGELLSALHFLHNKQHIAHRDVKPSNVVLDSTDKPQHIQLCDFGFAVLCPDSSTKCNKTFCGTPNFVPPELWGKKPYNGQMLDMWI